MIPNFINSSNKNKGSSLMSPANGLGGSRATITLFFSKAAAAPALRALKQKGKKEGGLGEGIFALLRLRLERFRFSLTKRNTKQKNFLFFLKEKIAREKIKKCRENFSVLVPPKRSGGGRKRTSLFWILFKKSSNINQKTPHAKNTRKGVFDMACGEEGIRRAREKPSWRGFGAQRPGARVGARENPFLSA
jgi:hypothetical protein